MVTQDEYDQMLKWLSEARSEIDVLKKKHTTIFDILDSNVDRYNKKIDKLAEEVTEIIINRLRPYEEE